MPQHRALVTAPFRGEGRATLEQIAEVVLDPWIDQKAIRIMKAEELAARVEAEGADLLVVESDSVNGPGARPPACSRSGRAEVTRPTSTSTRRRRAASRCCARPVATPTRSRSSRSGCCSRSTAASCAADADVREGQICRDGTIPYQRFRAWQLAGRTAGIVGLGAVGRATKWRLEGLGMRVIAHDPYAADATHTARRAARRGRRRHRCTPWSRPRPPA